MNKKELSEHDIQVPFVFSSNGDGFLSHNSIFQDGAIEREISMGDFFSPIEAIDYGDPEDLMKEYEEISKQLIATRDALKNELMQALGDR